jgi:hypothetical protein
MDSTNENFAPANIIKIETSKGLVSELVISLNDRNILTYKKNILEEYNKLIGRINLVLGDKKPSDLLVIQIWELGNCILETRTLIRKKYGADITNIIDAISIETNHSSRAIQYMVQFSVMIPKENINENISWGKYQEAIQLKKKEDFLECLNKINQNELKSSRDVRKFVREKNKKSVIL